MDLIVNPNNNIIKVAMVGGGFDSAVGRTHRAAIAIDQRYDLIAGSFSRDYNKCKATASHYGVDQHRAYTNLTELLEHEIGSLDAVIIATPQDQHWQQVMACLEAKIPVICEKALTTTSTEAIKIQEKLLEKNGFLAVTYNYTGYPMIRELKSMISSGMLGRIQQVQMEMPQEGFARVAEDGTPIKPQPWRLHDGDVPTLYLDLAVHLHMLARFLFGAKPVDVAAMSSSNGNFPNVIDSAQCLVRYSDGIHCGIWFSKAALGYRNGLRLRIFGDKGAVEWLQENPEHLQYANNKGTKYIIDRSSQGVQIANKARYQRFKAGHPAGFIEAFSNYYYDIADALLNFKRTGETVFGEYVFGASESIEGLKLLEAIALAGKNKKWEPVAI